MNKPTFSKFQFVHWSLYILVMGLIVAAGYGAYTAHTKLSQYVTAVDHLKTDSEINQQGIENARNLRKALDENKDNVDRAAAIVADTKYYEYQDQIVRDITAYTTASGLTVLGFDFASTDTNKKSAVKGVKTVVATIALKSPVPYPNYLRFLKLIEKNLTKMQVTQLEISNDLKTANTISTPIVTLEVFVR